MPENLVSRDGFDSPVPRQPARLHTYSDRLNLVLTYGIPLEFRGGVHIFIYNRHTPSGHAIAYRWHSLPRVRRHGASKPQGSSERVLPWQVTMDKIIFASLSHTHYWYEVGMSKVPYCTVFHVIRIRTCYCCCCCCLHIKNRSDLYPVPFSFLLFKAKKRISVVTR